MTDLMVDTRLSIEDAEAEPEVRFHRLECTMRVVLDTLPVVCCKIKSFEIAIRGLEDTVRQIIRVRN